MQHWKQQSILDAAAKYVMCCLFHGSITISTDGSAATVDLELSPALTGTLTLTLQIVSDAEPLAA